MEKLAFKFDPFKLAGVEKPKGNLKEIKSELAEFILDAVLDKIGNKTSPVKGGTWVPGLTKEYRKRKKEFTSATGANLELTGELLDNLKVAQTRDGELELRVKGSEELVGKAIGNNTGEYGKSSEKRPRQFIPEEDGTFKRDILIGMREIIEDLS